MKKNLREGFGYRLYTSQQIYIGDFKQGYKHGKGRILSESGNLLYFGCFENDKMTGKGKMNIPGRFYYHGDFLDNQIQGTRNYIFFSFLVIFSLKLKLKLFGYISKTNESELGSTYITKFTRFKT